jgi:hypothetical protein
MRISGASIIPSIAAAAVIFMVSSPVHGQQSGAECAEIENDQERLECFDRFYSGAVEGNAGASDTTSGADVRQARLEAEQAREEAAQARLEAEQLRQEIEQGRREVADLRRESDRRAEPEPEPERGTPEERFGMEKKVLELGGDEMSSTALGQFRFWNKGQRIELENGQVWEITNDTNLFHKTTNPRVTIEKGLFSAFYLHIDGVSKSLKVRRIR